MENKITKKTAVFLLIAGMLGCVLMAAGDWLMIYGDTSFEGNSAWLTKGVAAVPAGRNTAATVLAFPAVILYFVALEGISRFFTNEKNRRAYSFLTALGMTPWLCLHLLYTVIMYLFASISAGISSETAVEICEGAFNHFSWIVPVSEVIMLIPFFYMFFLIVTGKSIFPRIFAINNPLIIYVILKGITLVLPDTPFRLAFVNGLMSESMFVCFVAFAVYIISRGTEKRLKIQIK